MIVARDGGEETASFDTYKEGEKEWDELKKEEIIKKLLKWIRKTKIGKKDIKWNNLTWPILECHVVKKSNVIK